MRVLEFDSVSLAVDEVGDRSSPAVLLLAGATQSMDWWTPDFCGLLAEQGLRVIRFDQRDTGQSSASPPGSPDYSDADLAQDPIRILDALGIGSAHVVGLSMGGGLAQLLGLRCPRRVRTLTLIESSPIGGETAQLPAPCAALVAAERDLPSVADWADTQEVIDYRVAAERPYAGSLGFDEFRVRAIATVECARTTSMESAMSNHFLAGSGVPDGDSPEATALTDPSLIAAPTLVIHSDSDPFFPLPHGEALAAMIPNATLLRIHGMGHEAPPPQLWSVVVPAIRDHVLGHDQPGAHDAGTA